MTTLDKVRAEFISHYPKNYAGELELGGKSCVYSLNDILLIIDKYAEQEPCDDAISREELLKAIDTWDKFGCNADTKLVPYQDHYIPYIHYDDVVKCIKGMPSVRPKPTECGDVVSRQGCKVIEPYEAEVITRGNCMMCGKELTEGLFLCKECGEKARINELDK